MSLDERLDVVMHCIEIGEKSASKAEGKDVVMVVGNTGCGKRCVRWPLGAGTRVGGGHDAIANLQPDYPLNSPPPTHTHTVPPPLL